MKTSHFSFDLPEELIAQFPSDKRGESRLLKLDRKSGELSHHMISDITGLIPEDTLIVFNNSKVRKARLMARSETGGLVEFLLLRPLPDESGFAFEWLAMVSKAKKQRPGKKYSFPAGMEGQIIKIADGGRVVRFSSPVDDDWLDVHGHIPLPPYIKREDEFSDAERYQTIFSENPGSIAAPTAGLHFTKDILASIEAKGIDTVFISLHVGRGTFLPVRTENILDHKMHSEDYEISATTAGKINQAAADGKKILAVGTTSVRTLESEAVRTGGKRVEEGIRSTDIFIYPGYEFKLVNHMLTNFHTPESSLLMLVSAFAGKQTIDKAYREAIEQRYRFYSYGDAMLIL
ncbi:MAG: tRNA preQ1(34) S-adenosylmethionine ribosyltransferase-isomerase QueA [Spirochaetales bacterium]|nr:tRNA preQ1(34) S-adenosylmethionine ribosyltransferase-isomerase QueA [Spirochaetales bacterium]